MLFFVLWVHIPKSVQGWNKKVLIWNICKWNTLPNSWGVMSGQTYHNKRPTSRIDNSKTCFWIDPFEENWILKISFYFLDPENLHIDIQACEATFDYPPPLIARLAPNPWGTPIFLLHCALRHVILPGNRQFRLLELLGPLI